MVIILNIFTAFIIDSVTKEMEATGSDPNKPDEIIRAEEEIRRSSLTVGVPGQHWSIVKSARVDLNDSLGVPRLLH